MSSEFATDILRHHIRSRFDGPPEGLDRVLRCFKTVNAKKNQFLLSAGSVCTQVFFVARGGLQVFVVASNEEETTRDIFLDEGWCADLASFGKETEATENIRALEDSWLLAIEKRNFDELHASVEPFRRVFQQILLEAHTRYVDRINSLVSLTAAERIDWLQKNRPELLTRVSQKVIASFLGVSPETFSRLK